MEERIRRGTAEAYQTAEAAKYCTPHFKAGGLTGIISPDAAAEFIVADEENNLVPEADGEIQHTMEQMLRL